MPIAALFDINVDGQDRGFQAANAQSLSLKLRDPSSASTVLFQVYNPAAVDPSQGIAANPPRASKGAPVLTLVGATSGQAVSPSTVSGAVTAAMPVSGSHSWIVRCVVNGGVRSLPGGTTVADPSLVYERGIWIPTSYGTRKVVATESQHFELEGWAGALSDFFDQGAAPLAMFTPPGAGAVARSVSDRMVDEIHVTDFMTDAERADVRDCTLLYDHQPAIQAAIDYALYRSTYSVFAAGPKVKVPGGVMRVDRTIHANYGVDPRSIIIEGEGQRYGGPHGICGVGSTLVITFEDAPGIAIQGGYNVTIRNLFLEGPRSDYLYNKTFAGAYSGADVNPSAWVDPALPAASSSRYAPLAGIAIDPYAGSRPATSYPDVPYPEWLGATPQYGKFLSSNVMLDNVSIWGFVVGVALQPCDADGNGDFVKMRHCFVRFCQYGFSWGNSQSRVLHFEDCCFSSMHTALTSGVHGRRSGEPLVLLDSCSFDLMMRIIDMATPNYGQCPTFVSCFAEAIYSIGLCNGGGASSSSGMKFIGCQFGFSWWAIYGVPTHVLEMGGSMAQTVFDNCYFYVIAGPVGSFLHFRGDWNTYEGGRNFQFNNCHRLALEMNERYQQCAFNATLGITVSYGSTCIDRYAMSSGYVHNLDSGAVRNQLYTEHCRGPRELCLPVYSKRIQSIASNSQAGDPGTPVSWRVNELAASLVGISGRRVTVTLTGATTASLMHTGGDVGDIIVCQSTGAAFLVRSRTAAQIIMEAVSGFDVAENLLTAVPASPSLWAIHCRRFALDAVFYADIAAGSAVATNVVSGLSPADLAANFHVGDYLFVDVDVDAIIDPANARIVSIDNTAKSITFAGNFLVTQTRRRISIFVRPAMPNAA